MLRESKSPQTSQGRWLRRAVFGALALICIPVLIVAVSNILVLVKGNDSVSNPEDAPHAQTAIVLGALVEPDGDMSKMLADRVDQAVQLWKDGKVDRVLVSGDHGQWTYDEPTVMKNAVIRGGVRPRDVFTDHAGFNTWATMERAKKVFQVDDALVVTQGFHMPRALYLADEAGLNATGVTSDLHSYGKEGFKSDIREFVSRPKAVFDVLRDAPTVGGPPVPITGDGRTSWGPKAPPGSD
jgi:SanA protein